MNWMSDLISTDWVKVSTPQQNHQRTGLWPRQQGMSHPRSLSDCNFIVQCSRIKTDPPPVLCDAYLSIPCYFIWKNNKLVGECLFLNFIKDSEGFTRGDIARPGITRSQCFADDLIENCFEVTSKFRVLDFSLSIMLILWSLDSAQVTNMQNIDPPITKYLHPPCALHPHTGVVTVVFVHIQYLVTYPKEISEGERKAYNKQTKL